MYRFSPPNVETRPRLGPPLIDSCASRRQRWLSLNNDCKPGAKINPVHLGVTSAAPVLPPPSLSGDLSDGEWRRPLRLTVSTLLGPTSSSSFFFPLHRLSPRHQPHDLSCGCRLLTLMEPTCGKVDNTPRTEPSHSHLLLG